MKKLLILTLATQLTVAQTVKEEAEEFGARLAEIVTVPVKDAFKQIRSFPAEQVEKLKDTLKEIAESDTWDDVKSVGKQYADFPVEQFEEVKEVFIEADIVDDAKSLGHQFAEPVTAFWAGVISFVKTAKAEFID